jgi:hypothetical protein
MRKAFFAERAFGLAIGPLMTNARLISLKWRRAGPVNPPE